MEYKNELYECLSQKKNNSYGKVDMEKPVVVFMDGVGITRMHKKYPLMEKDGYLSKLHECAKQTACNIGTRCIVYTAMDEVSFVFPNAGGLFSAFHMGNTVSYTQALFLQNFNRIFWEIYPEVDHKITLFNIEKGEEDAWVQYRRAVCRKNSAVYMAKEFLSKDEYHGLSGKGIMDLLKNKNLICMATAGRDFFEGMEYRHEIMDSMDLNVFE